MAQEIAPERDFAANSGGMSIFKLETLIEDIRNQPEWRTDADKAARFYDGYQLTAQRIAELESLGIPVSITNLMARAINGALGMEAKTRLNWKVTSDDDAFMDVASVINMRLAEAQRETYADMACSDAYKDELVPGIGWVEVSRNPDPLEYRYRCQHVHRNEIWWDWRARRKDLKDARWLVRQRWVDLDEAEVSFAKYKKVLKLALSSSPLNDALQLTVSQLDSLERLREIRDTFKVNIEDWLDTGRNRVRMYEVWYRVPFKAVVIEDNNGNRVRFNERNPLHQEAVRRGIGTLITGTSYALRKAIFAGPYRLSDELTTKRNFPYIPFWCYRNDENRTPYGLALGMISPQEEYNERRSKLLWLLRAAQVFVDDDALDLKTNNFLDLAREIMRPDATIVLNAKRANGQNGLVVNHNIALAREQVDVMMDAKQLIQEQPGVLGPMFGDTPAGTNSGIALNSLVEQSIVALGEVNDNYRMGRRLVGEALVDLIVEDHKREGMRVMLGHGRKARPVVLNVWSERGEPINQVAAAPIKTGLEDVPSTPAYRMQQQQELGKVIQALGGNPTAIAVLAPAFVEATDLPNKDIYAEWMRKQAGVPDPNDQGDDEQDQAERLAMEQQRMALEQMRVALDEAQAKVADLLSKVELNEAKTAEIRHRIANPEPADPAAQKKALIDESIAEARAA